MSLLTGAVAPPGARSVTSDCARAPNWAAHHQSDRKRCCKEILHGILPWGRVFGFGESSALSSQRPRTILQKFSAVERGCCDFQLGRPDATLIHRVRRLRPHVSLFRPSRMRLVRPVVRHRCNLVPSRYRVAPYARTGLSGHRIPPAHPHLVGTADAHAAGVRASGERSYLDGHVPSGYPVSARQGRGAAPAGASHGVALPRVPARQARDRSGRLCRPRGGL